jgi:hypothetical protein
MHIKKLWAHAYYTTTFTRWAHVGFAEILGLFAHGFYRLYHNLFTALCAVLDVLDSMTTMTIHSSLQNAFPPFFLL